MIVLKLRTMKPIFAEHVMKQYCPPSPVSRTQSTLTLVQSEYCSLDRTKKKSHYQQVRISFTACKHSNSTVSNSEHKKENKQKLTLQICRNYVKR